MTLLSEEPFVKIPPVVGVPAIPSSWTDAQSIT